MIIKITTDKALLSRHCDKNYAEKHAGKVYTDAKLWDNGIVQSSQAGAKFWICCFDVDANGVIRTGEKGE